MLLVLGLILFAGGSFTLVSAYLFCLPPGYTFGKFFSYERLTRPGKQLWGWGFGLLAAGAGLIVLAGTEMLNR